MVWILECWRPDTPYLLVEIIGPPGSGKTTLHTILCRLIDNQEHLVRAFPRKRDDLAADAAGNHLLSFDNVGEPLSREMSDMLCGLCTGFGYAKRELYSDFRQASVNIHRPLLINGISGAVRQDDLIDRSIRVELPPLEAGRRAGEKELADKFETDAPEIMAGLLDLFSRALAVLPNVNVENPPRMVDFARLCKAVDEVYGWQKESLVDAFRQNQMDSLGLENEDATINAVIAYMKLHGRFEGANRELLDHIIDDELLCEGVTESPKNLGKLLQEYRQYLEQAGVTIAYPTKNNGERARNKNGVLIELKSSPYSRTYFNLS